MLLTWAARGLGGDAAYLSLIRGDGGQNLIGPELGDGLGLLQSGDGFFYSTHDKAADGC